MSSNFPGFSLPKGAWLPPELLDILPEIRTVSELKVTIAAIHETLRLGSEGSIISLTDFEALTGLDRKSVSRGVQAALERGTMERREAGNTYLYRLKFQARTYTHQPAGESQGRGKMPLADTAGRGKMPPNRGKMPPIEGEMPPNGGEMPLDVVMHDTSHPSEDMQISRAALVAEMRELHVSLRVAQKLASKYDAEYLREKLEQTRYAVEAGIAEHGPGWFVASVREDWQAPLGFRERDKPKTGSREDRQRYISGKYADQIKH